MSLYVKGKDLDPPVELAPCPFCGSRNLYVRVDENKSYYDPLFVTCNDCNAEGPQNYDKPGTANVDRWNKRIDKKDS